MTSPLPLASTLASAIEDASKSAPTIGFRFVPESGVPAHGGPGDSSEASFSYTAIERASARYGGALQALGLKKGERVALILPTNEDFVLCFFGAVRAGLVPVPIYPPLGLGELQGYLDNTRHIVHKSGARAVVTDSRIKRMLGTVQAACPELRQVVAVESIRESRESLRPELIARGDVALLQFTSGSTSRPKGVTLTHENLTANIRCLMDGLGTRADDVGVSWLPLYHDMGLIGFVLAPLFYRIPSVFLPPLLFLKRPASWLQALSRHKGTVSFAPNFAYALATKRVRERELEGVDLSAWRVAGCGAEPIRPETLEAFATTFSRVGFDRRALMPSYGMAESTLAVAFSRVGQGVRTLSVDGATLWAEGRAVLAAEDAPGVVRLVSCGARFEGHDLQLFADDDDASARPLPADTVGEIRVRGPSVMRGYWQDEERSREARAGEFTRTGDLGFLHDGEIYICGRSKEVVILNGRNYYPQDMEWEAAHVDGVRRGNVIAFGARDTHGGDPDRERVVVAFEAQDVGTLGDSARTDALVLAVRAAVQSGMGLVLDDVVPLPPGALPKTSSGKLQRSMTRELYEAGELRDRRSGKEPNRVALAAEAARSQLSYFKLAILGGRKLD